MKRVKEWGFITFGTMLIAVSVFFFMMPSHLAVGSVSGLSIVLCEITGLSVPVISMGLNIVLLAVGMVLIGRDFGVKTIYTSLALPVMLEVLERFLEHVKENGFTALELSWSPVRGPEGNIEYLGWLRKAAWEEKRFDLTALVEASHEELENRQ